jgi:hypothetical protein
MLWAMKRSAWVLAWASAWGACQAEDEAMKPFVIDWRGSDRALVDMSGLLDKPAGKDGFAQVRDGHLFTPSGRRIRIWGVNFTGGACYPEKADAPAVAEHLARFGINCVRFHFLDSNWGKDASIFPPGADTTRRLDAAQLDRLDYFVAQLKQRGIYSNFNLNVGRVYRKADGVADCEQLGLGKALQYFDDRIAELHREYAEQLLTHRNPYTQAEYRREPALLIVELLNENSIVESWFAGRLRGRHTGKQAGTWSDITAHYAELMTRKFNEHLAARHPAAALRRWRDEAGVGAEQPIPRLQAEQFAKASGDRFAAEAAFYMELEDGYFQRIHRLLKELGVQALIVGTSDHNHWKTGYPLVASAAKLDVVDGHVYWQHPGYTVDAKTKKRGFWIANSPMVNDPLDSTVVQLARTAVAAKPYTVSEVNHPFPSEYACEGIPILAAYALLQDWDGIFFYTFEHADPAEWMQRRCGHFEIRSDPVKMAQLAACAAMFHRADVAAARKTVHRSYSMEQVIESIRMSTSQRPLYTPGFSRAIPLVHATRVRSFGRGKTDYPKLEPSEPIVSDTGELTWRRRDKQSLVSVETDRTQALIGFVGGRRRSLKNLAVEVEPAFCSIVLTSLDGKPLADSDRMLLTAGARTAATAMRWDDQRHSLVSWGRLPMRIEPVTGGIVLRGRRSDAPLEIVPLDGAGAPLGEAKAAARSDKGPQLLLDQPTVWYLIRPVAKR